MSLSNKSAVITLGGKGTRLSEVTKNIPKPLWPINGINTLERIILNLSNQGVNKFFWLLGYKYDSFLKESKLLQAKYGVEITLYKEEFCLGEAGALFEIIDFLDDIFLFVNGDIIFDIDIDRLYAFHKNYGSDISFITHLTSHPEDSDCISEKHNFSISKYKFKNQNILVDDMYLGNAGIALLSKKVVKNLKEDIYKVNLQYSLFKDFIVEASNRGFFVFSYNTSEYLKDIGTPSRLRQVSSDIKKDKVSNDSYRKSQKVLFLDRDDTLISCPKHQYILDGNFQLKEKIVKYISKIAQNYNFVILITNQPQIAMGLVSYQQVIDINAKLILSCQKLGLNIAACYVCPHHNHKGYGGEISFLKTSCFCRKPLPGNFLKAAYERNINLKESLLIGDSWRDNQAAKIIGMKFINVKNL